VQLLRSPAIILRHVPYGEADLIIRFLTPEGVQAGFARNARKSRKRFGASLDLFAGVEMHWKQKPGQELLFLEAADLLDLRAGLRRDLVGIALAGYGCELLEALLGEAREQAELYALLAAYLDQLVSGEGRREAKLLLELRLLDLAGYIPHLLHCSLCLETIRDEALFFAADHGGTLCPACARGRTALPVSNLTLGTIHRCLQTPLTRFAGFRFGAKTLQEGGDILAAAIAPHLNRPLQSLTLLAAAGEVDDLAPKEP